MIILRYLSGTTPVERFIEYVDVTDRSASGLTSTLKTALEPFQAKNTLVSQTFDGAAVISGGVSGVQTLMKVEYPHAKFFHCYAHLILILKQACSSITKSKIFFANASGFSTFFSHSSKRNDALRAVTKRAIPRPADTRWNYQSRLIATIHEWKDDFTKCFQSILGENWDEETIRKASGLLLTRDPTFLFLCNTFS